MLKFLVPVMLLVWLAVACEPAVPTPTRLVTFAPRGAAMQESPREVYLNGIRTKIAEVSATKRPCEKLGLIQDLRDERQARVESWEALNKEVMSQLEKAHQQARKKCLAVKK